MLADRIATLLVPLDLGPVATMFLANLLLVVAIMVVTVIVTLIVRRILLHRITLWIQNNRYRWDDPLATNRLLTKISWFVPLAIISLAVEAFLEPSSKVYLIARQLVTAGCVVVTVLSLNSLLSVINDIYRIVRKQRGSTLKGYTDAGKILVFILGAIFLISIFTGRSPWGIVSVLGGLTAVTMLVFKDSILGFVASVQLTAMDMVRIGDWIEMSQYGADGDVIDMSIHSIRVQNWDKTITTIPTYALVSSSFRNWRGMSESGGRRIKRSINIDISSIRFCDDEMLNRFSSITLISDYVQTKQQDILEHNRSVQFDESCLINGRCQTNVGVFRAYVIAYLKNNPNINDQMTFLVRQLAPMDRGLPLEIYVFSRDKAWANYEAIQADIFDHLLAAAPVFGLRIFQSPSGYDLQHLAAAPVSH